MIAGYLFMALLSGAVAGIGSLAAGQSWWIALLVGYAGAFAGVVMGVTIRLAALQRRDTALLKETVD